jgi:hypothetical protein
MKSFCCPLIALLSAVGSASARPCAICQKQVVQAPVYQQQVVVPLQAPVYYNVGQQLQQVGAAEGQFRLSPSWQEYQKLKAFTEGQQFILQAQQLQLQQYEPAPEETEQPEPGYQAAEPPPFAETHPILASKCAKCHTEGGSASDYIRLDGSEPIDKTAIGSILEQVHNEKMPKKGAPLSPQEKFELAEEICLSVPEDEKPVAPSGPTPKPQPFPKQWVPQGTATIESVPVLAPAAAPVAPGQPIGPAAEAIERMRGIRVPTPARVPTLAEPLATRPNIREFGTVKRELQAIESENNPRKIRNEYGEWSWDEEGGVWRLKGGFNGAPPPQPAPPLLPEPLPE